MSIEITFLGTGDAFGHGGRLQACFFIRSEGQGMMLDCGASVLIGLQKYGVAPNDVDTILISHLHGDHFGGIPFYILDAQLHSKRKHPLTIAGPPGLSERYTRVMEVMFPTSSKIEQKFEINIVELEPGKTWEWRGTTVDSVEVRHPSGDPALAFRIGVDGKSIAYTGDTEWVDSLAPLLGNADLLIAEAYFFEKNIKFHLNYQTLVEHLPELAPKQAIITHMSQDMLDRLEEADLPAAQDGMIIQL
jgi:ribonuclease BN (tRNA processing enzyme)